MIDLEKLDRLRADAEFHAKTGRAWQASARDVIDLLDHIAQLEKDVDQQKGRADFWNARARVHRKARSKLFLQVRELEKDARRWNAATRNMELNDVCVVVYDNFGDGRTVTGEDADKAIDTAMEEKHG